MLRRASLAPKKYCTPRNTPINTAVRRRFPKYAHSTPTNTM
jgi:hypothetical protein